MNTRERIGSFLAWMEKDQLRCVFYCGLFVTTCYCVPMMILALLKQDQAVFPEISILGLGFTSSVLASCMAAALLNKIWPKLKLSCNHLK